MAGRETVGNFKFQFEEFDDPRPGGSGKLQRTVRASGPLVAKRTNVTRDSTVVPLMGPLGSFAFRVTGLDRGHLIALELGGPDCPENLVPMYAQFNQSGEWKGLEKELANDGAKAVRINIYYNDDIPFLPKSFLVSWTIEDKTGNEERKSRIIRMRAYAPKPYVAPDDYSGFKAIIKPHLPATKDPYEPYAFLEKLRGPLGLKPPEENKGFSEAERVAVKVANALYDEQAGNKGFLMSDDASDPYQTLNEKGNDDQPQVDHIVPESVIGSNSFRNAKLLSKKLNNIKRAKLEQEYMDVAKVAANEYKSRREPKPINRYNPY
jgi:hypothetical protein